jgi:rubrerythrin
MQFNTPIFSNRAIKSLGQKYDQFENEFICNWLYNTYLGEYETTLVYPALRNNFEQNYYHDLNLTHESQNLICQYFDRMIHDEEVHAKMLLDFLKNNFNKDVSQHDLNSTKIQAQDRLKNCDLTQLLTRYYVGECYLWTGFYLIYKNCQNQQTAKMFHRLVVDESHHNNNIFKIYQKLNNSIKLEDDNYVDQVTELRYFGLGFIKNFFELNDDTSKKSKWFLNLIYDHDWQRQFNLIFLKKTFKLYSLFNPKSDLDSYCRIINKHVLTIN